MRTVMREQRETLLNEQKVKISERNQFADRLLEEKWMKREGLNEGLLDMYAGNKAKARALAIAMENQEFHLQNLSEDQISTAFQTTPHNVLRVVRLGYPNSIRDEIFMDWPMETARDAIYYLTPIQANTIRDGVAGSSIYNQFDWKWSSEITEQTVATTNGSTLTWTVTFSPGVIRAFSVKWFLDEVQVANDDGAGNIVALPTWTGPALSGTNGVGYGTDSTAGTSTITFASAPTTGKVLMVQFFFLSEDSTQYSSVAEIQLQLRDYQFRVKPWPITFGYSKMTELLLGTTLNIDAEEALIRGAGDELKKSLDFFALRLAYRVSNSNATTTFNVTGAVGEAEVLRMNAFSRSIGQAGNKILNVLNRGGITKLAGGPDAIEQIKLHSRFKSDGAQPAIGAHKVGSLDGIDIYKAPSAIIPNDTILGVYKNPEIPEDVSIAFGTLIPLYVTQALEFKNMNTQRGLAYFGDVQVLNSQYIVKIVLSNIPS